MRSQGEETSKILSRVPAASESCGDLKLSGFATETNFDSDSRPEGVVNNRACAHITPEGELVKSVSSPCKLDMGENCCPEPNNNKQIVQRTSEVYGSESSIFTLYNQRLTENFCRICHCEEGTLGDVLIAPCKCKGSMAYVHHSCLQHWIKSSGSKCCELCGFHFAMNSKLKPLMQWEKLAMTKMERRRLSFSVVFHVIAIICVVWSLYVLIERSAVELYEAGQLQWTFWTKIVVIAVGLIGGLSFMIIQCKVYVNLWKRLKSYNRVIWVQNRPAEAPAPDNGRTKNSSSQTVSEEFHTLVPDNRADAEVRV